MISPVWVAVLSGRMAAGTQIQFLGGVNEIGGNKVLLEDRGTRILLDFGKSYKARSKYYDWNEIPRIANGVGDFIVMGLLPDVKGIYREDLLSLAGRPPKEDRCVDAVFLSHAHSDHADYVSFLREDIPLYLGETTKKIIESLEEERRGARIEFEITGYKRRPIERGSERIERKIHTFTTSSTPKEGIQIDSISVKPIHVDHSIPGCYAFIITTSSKTIVYSGDLRIHGNNSMLTRDFVESARQSSPDLLISEGTRINETMIMKEKDVYDICAYFLDLTGEHLVYADYSYKDIDRFTTFYNVAKNSGRKLLIDARVLRYLLALSSGPNPMNLPSIKDDENISVYKPREKSGSYVDSDYSVGDRDLYESLGEKVWTASDVREDPSKVIIALGSYQIDQLVDIMPKAGLYLHSASEPFNEEGTMSEMKIGNWMELFGLQRIHAHCSGHASGRDLNEIINSVGPKTIIPIHTEYPGLFKLIHESKVTVPDPMKEIVI